MLKLVNQYNAGKVSVDEFKDLDANIFLVNYKSKPDYVISTVGDKTLVLDITIDENLMLEGLFRELVRSVQVLRKEADFNIEDRVEMDTVTESETLNKVVAEFGDKIKQDALVLKLNEGVTNPDIEKEVEVGDEKIVVKLKVVKK